MIQDNLVEYEFLMFHELRHYHQFFVWKRFDASGLVVNESRNEIEQWKTDFLRYKRNDGNTNARVENAEQIIERDANAYAVIILNLYHAHDGIQLILGVPPITSYDIQRYQKERTELQSAFALTSRDDYLPEMIKPLKLDPKIDRNSPCPCGSGLKYKKCKCKEYHVDYR